MSENQEIKDVSSFPVSLIFALILSVAIVLFALQNSQDISLKALTWSTEIPLVLLLFITLAIGVIMTILYSIPSWNRRRKLKNQLKKRIKTLEKEITSLKEKESIKSIEDEPNMGS